MSNLTIAVDDDLIRQARVKAIAQGTSVSAKIREFLVHYVHNTTTPVVPTPTAAAVAFIDTLINSPGVAMLAAQDEWPKLRALCLMRLPGGDVGLAGPVRHGDAKTVGATRTLQPQKAGLLGPESVAYKLRRRHRAIQGVRHDPNTHGQRAVARQNFWQRLHLPHSRLPAPLRLGT
ncbi:MAG: hypothetical protein OHK0048_08270 [Rhodoferax sp.]